MIRPCMACTTEAEDKVLEEYNKDLLFLCTKVRGYKSSALHVS